MVQAKRPRAPYLPEYRQIMRLRQAFWLLSSALPAAGVIACATTGTHARTSDCLLEARDSVLLGEQPLYRDCAVTVRATRISVGTHPDFRPPNFRAGCFSADIRLVVDTLGLPEPNTARIVRTNDPTFGDAVLLTVPS